MRYKCSNYAENKSYIIVNDNMGGKMKGVPCISSICICNDRCIERMKNPNLICHECYVQGQLYKKGLVENCIQNYELMNERLLEEKEFPHFLSTVPFVRDESFGDTGSVLHAMNYIVCCNANPNVSFTPWTKNPDFWDEAFKIMGKPKNLIMVLSSIKVNECTQSYKKYDWVDHVFTVYTIEYVKEHGVRINCGWNICVECQNCYLTTDGKPFFINELLKKHQTKQNLIELKRINMI